MYMAYRETWDGAWSTVASKNEILEGTRKVAIEAIWSRPSPSRGLSYFKWSPRTVHSNCTWSPRHVWEGSGAGFWICMVSRVSLKGLYGKVRLQGVYGRVSLQGLSWGDQIWRSGQSGGTTILGGPLTAWQDLALLGIKVGRLWICYVIIILLGHITQAESILGYFFSELKSWPSNNSTPYVMCNIYTDIIACCVITILSLQHGKLYLNFMTGQSIMYCTCIGMSDTKDACMHP